VAAVDALRARRTFARLDKVLDVPNLIDIQRRSFAWLTDTKAGGLRETIDDISPIEDYTGNLAVQFGEFTFDEPVAPIDECREKDLTYARPLTVTVAFVNRETGEIREQSVFMGDFPWMTEWGTFIINGTERVVVTQLVRSPGAYLMEPKDREKQVFIANLMPARGSWLELEIDKKGKVFVRIDRKRKLPVTVLLRAMGYAGDEEILKLFGNSIYVRNTIDAVLVVLGGILLLYVGPARSYWQTWNDARAKRADLQRLQREHARLVARRRALREPASLMREARRLGMVRQGERAFVVSNLPPG
jgi:DNA-directed RNA polymerase subunit beta